MLLQQIFTPGHIKVGLKSEDKDALFEELVDVLAAAEGRDFPRADALRALREREDKMSTGIRKGVALPHGKAESLGGLRGVLGIAHRGIEYASLDGEPVHVVFMLLSSPNDSELHLGALKGLARLLDNPEFYSELLAARNEDQAFDTIKSFEGLIRIA